MKKTTKIWLITASFLVVIGSILFVCIMSALKWDFTKLSTTKYESKHHEISDTFKNISVSVDTADIVFVPSENAVTKVSCYEEKNVTHSVTVKDGTLLIEVSNNKKWYENIGINFSSPKITIYLPENEYGTLSVKSHTGDVKIPKDFEFESIEISENTGDVTSFADTVKGIKINTDTGNIRLEKVSAESLSLSVSTGDITVSDVLTEGDIKTYVSTGKTNIKNTKCKNLISSGSTGDIVLNNVVATEKFTIKRSTGDVRFNSSDAKEIFIKTDTGDVTGRLLSEKVFITSTDTGDVTVPHSITGGRCEITTDTGDIKIKIE